MTTQKYIFLLLAYSFLTFCSQEKIFYFHDEAPFDQKKVVAVPNNIIKKTPWLQTLCLLTAYKTDDKKKAIGKPRQFYTENSENNPIKISHEIYQDISMLPQYNAIITQAYTQLKSTDTKEKYLKCLRDNTTNIKLLYCAAWNFRKLDLCKLAITCLSQELASQMLSLYHLKTNPTQAIMFADPEEIAASAISPNGSYYAIAEKNTKHVSLFKTDMHDTTQQPVATIPIVGSTQFTDLEPYLRFIKHDITLLLRPRDGRLMQVISGASIDTLSPQRYSGMCANIYDLFVPHPDMTKNIIAFFRDKNVYVSSMGLYCTSTTSIHKIERPTIKTPGIEWNRTGNRLLCHAHIYSLIEKTEYKNDIYILNYDVNTNIVSDRVDLESNNEYMYAARWINEDYMIGLSDSHLFIWNLEEKQICVFNEQQFSCLKKLQHTVTKTQQQRSFYPGKIALDTNRTTCFIDQAMGNCIIAIDLDTYIPKIITLQKLNIVKEDIDQKDREYQKYNIKTAFSPNGAVFAVFYNNTLSLYDTETGFLLGVSKNGNKITSLEFSRTGDKLFAYHHAGFNIYDLVDSANNLEKFQEDIIKKIESPQQQKLSLFWITLPVITIIGGLLVWKYLNAS